MKQLLTVPVSKLISHPKNSYYFDDISGDAWKEFLKSIKTSGVIEPIVITQNNIIVSGHQRVKACKELGINEIRAEIKTYKSDDEILKQLIETNIRQRGVGNPNPVKFGRCIKDLERIYGIHNGNQLSNNFKAEKSQEDLASELGMTVQTLHNYKALANAIPEIQSLIESGKVTKTVALSIMKQLSEEEQKQLASELVKKDKTNQREVTFYINRIKELNAENETLRNKKPEIREVVKEVLPSDYENLKISAKEVSDLKQKVSALLSQRTKDQEEIERLKNKPCDNELENRFNKLADDYSSVLSQLQAKDIELANMKERLDFVQQQHDTNTKVFQNVTTAYDFYKACERFVKEVVANIVYDDVTMRDQNNDCGQYITKGINLVTDGFGDIQRKFNTDIVEIY